MSFGNGAEYLVRRLKRDRPDIAQRLAAGAYPSARAAALEAGIIRRKSSVDRAFALVLRMTVAQREEFLELVEALKTDPKPPSQSTLQRKVDSSEGAAR